MQAIVIDDSRSMRSIIRRTLSGMGFECIEAGDGLEALAALKKLDRVPPLAMVDWNMPNMNGFEFVQAIRKDHAYDDMKLVMVTTEVEMERIVAALEAGANEYVMKPFTEEAMKDKIALLQIDGVASEAA